MATKRCSDCKETKPVEMFNKDKSRGDGLAYRCKSCSSFRCEMRYFAKKEYILAKSKSHYQENRELRAKQAKAWQEANAERVKANRAKYREANKTTLAEQSSAWAKANRHLRNASVARYRAAQLQATPTWADKEAIAEAYEFTKVRERMCGGRWSVDHIVPLRSPKVCGLHVEHNLRVIPLNENKAKGNLYWQEMPNG